MEVNPFFSIRDKPAGFQDMEFASEATATKACIPKGRAPVSRLVIVARALPHEPKTTKIDKAIPFFITRKSLFYNPFRSKLKILSYPTLFFGCQHFTYQFSFNFTPIVLHLGLNLYGYSLKVKNIKECSCPT
jgi:hypothetical protein